MAMAQRLELRQSQAPVMTPQLRQAIRLLALSNLEIEAVIGEALAENPLLDLAEVATVPGDETTTSEALRRTKLESSPVDRLIGEGRAAEDRPLDIDPVSLDGSAGGGAAGWETDWGSELRGGAAPDAGPDIEDRAAAATTLAEHLHAQLGAAAGDPETVAIARHIVGLLDEAGYLSLAIEEIASDLDILPGRVEAALGLVQSLDPVGVGARTLAECIALQAREVDRHDPAMARLIDSLDLVARGELARLRRVCGVDDDDLADMIAELRAYDPKPGLRFGAAAAAPVTPDVLIEARDDGGWDITLEQATLPRLVVNRGYYLELRATGCDRAAKAWLSEKLSDANWIVKALDQRQKTILRVAAEIVRLQEGFFRRGVAELKPLTLRTVADAIGMHESTVSRVTSNKYLLCARGTFELKYFFTSGIAATGGEGPVSAEAVKAAIRQLIEGEVAAAILSDDALVELLRGRGFDLARRTVAKYREAIGLGSSVQRRRQKALAGLR